jgi:hypothetical protein
MDKMKKLSAALTETQEIRATGNKANEYCDDNNNEILIDASDEDSINLAPDADAEDEEGEMADEEDVQEDGVLEEDEEIMIGGRRSKKVKVSKGPLLQFAGDKDTYALGRDKLIKTNLPLVRRRKQQREAREQQALVHDDNLYDALALEISLK